MIGGDFFCRFILSKYSVTLFFRFSSSPFFALLSPSPPPSAPPPSPVCCEDASRKKMGGKKRREREAGFDETQNVAESGYVAILSLGLIVVAVVVVSSLL